MINERVKKAESIDTVYTHHILTNKIGGRSGAIL